MPSDTYPFGQSIAWTPDPATCDASRLMRFAREHGVDSYPALLDWARADIDRFWDAVLQDLDVRFSHPYRRAYEPTGDPAFPRWCPEGRLNITQTLLDKWIAGEAAERDAIRYESEEGEVEQITYRDLHARVEQLAASLRASGIGAGDAVGLLMPMTPEIVVAFLAIVRIGGVVLPLFSGYGEDAIATRLAGGDAKALFVSNASPRRGRAVDLKGTADRALEGVPSVQLVVVHERIDGHEVAMTEGRDVMWSEFLARGEGASGEAEDTSAEDVLMLIYTSGTTGRPKGAVHTHCGFPVKGAQDMVHCMDVREGDVIYWMTDMGWMMGPWLVFGALAAGATMVLYDGAPDFPDAGRLWQTVDRLGVTHLGVSPTLIRALRGHGPEPLRAHDLSRLRLVASTGSPWDPESWRWCFEHVLGGTRPILNYSGGTEISGGIVCGNLCTPAKPGSFSGPVPGMDADVVDGEGNSVRGEVGELVIRQPWIGMTRGFRDDPERYRDSYWTRFPGLWTHGDFAAIDADGLWYVVGRSDDTIKVAGKRLGPAEVESVVVADPRVAECAVVGVPDEIKGQAVVVFVVVAEGAEATDTLRSHLIDRIVGALGKPLKPKALLFADDLPRTRNAKLLRRHVRAAHLGEDVGDTTSLLDPAALDAVRNAR
jgi:acetyl-CoA synthetase